ncbi:NYN domain-containing protein [Phytopseudomonas punonensis]|uniref:Uncharacterized conserved protein, LabA/DUF88 family n=1 Tax=Phytopseudomonas punonensis TaxID=1220495 RepID=A0A1M7LFM8_9GAMM|nr:NYN domain-containing protein [Pseudomonas punonensis]SHM76878.1 Uncharacterized conserved protein, LabA/DUF88 family [Pseudomonas punonensis]
MGRVGIFVDAGYLFAQGSVTISGDEVKRHFLSLNEQAVIAQLIASANELTGGAPLLRIYWYDAISLKGPNLEQKRLASSNNLKFRAGTLNGSGQQKGVDSMIVIDMIELARNHAISDAVLLSGDEDVRVGVQFAQNYGVRVHLIGIGVDAESQNQSESLWQEADMHLRWTADVVSGFLSIRQAPVKPAQVAEEPAVVGQAAAANGTAANDEQAVSIISRVASEFVQALVHNDLVLLKQHLASKTMIPPEFDAKLLGKSREAIHRQLTPAERKMARKSFIEQVKSR